MIILDTCTLLWLASDHARLSRKAKERIAGAAGSIFISSISGFEIALKHQEGRLVLPLEPSEWMGEALAFHGIAELPVDCEIAARSVRISLPHGDPCDRMIAATAELKRLTLLTPDPVLRSYRGIASDW